MTNQTNPSEILTPRKLRHRKVAQGVLAGKTYSQIAQDIGSEANYPRQTLYETVQSQGVQQEIAKQVAQLDFNKSDIREAVARRIARIKSSDGQLGAGDARVLEIAARIEAMLTDRQIVENIESTDTLLAKAQQAVDKLTHDTESERQITGLTLSCDAGQSDMKQDTVHSQNDPPGSGTGVEATRRAESE